MRLVAHDWRDLARHGRGVVGPLDRRLLTRMVDAIEAGLALIEVCRPDDYEGPYADLVRDVERTWPRSIDVPTPQGVCTVNAEHLASMIIHETADSNPGALALRWLPIGYLVPLGQNDACEADFEPIVRADPTALTWHVAASLYTWAHSGVWTPPILQDTLRRWTSATPALERWCRAQQDAGDPYVRFMAAYATRLLDGQAARHDSTWLGRYFELVGALQSA